MDLTRPGCRVSESAVRDMVTDIEDTMNETDVQNTIMVTLLLDNSIFLVETPGGKKKLPMKGNNGQCHIEGHIYVTPREPIKDLFSIITLILKAGGTAGR